MAAQTEHRFELIVVDDGSRDETAAVLDKLCGETAFPLVPVRLVDPAGPAAARNAGWRTARAPLVAFTDDDCVPQPDWLAALIARLEEADLVQGRTIPNPDHMVRRGPFSRVVAVEEANWRYETCNVAYRRAVLERVGGFDEGFVYSSVRRHGLGPIFGEDVDLAWRARESGATAAFEPRAAVLHDIPPSSVRGRLREARRAEGMPRLLRRHPQLRREMHLRLFLVSSHLPALVAAAGTSLALRRRAPVPLRVLGLLMWLPYADNRLHRMPLWTRRRNQLALLPVALGADLFEIGVLARASAREHTLLL